MNEQPLLLRVKREFNAMTPARLMACGRDPTFPWHDDTIQHALSEMLVSPLNSALPPSADYTRSVVKHLISSFEKMGIEVSDELYGVYVRCASTGCGEQDIYRTFWFTPDVHLTMCERREFISKGTTGLTTWQAGPAMIEWLLHHDGRSVLGDRTVMELGSGTGLLGMAVCQLFAPRKVFLTDSHEDVLAALHHNVAVNGLEGTARVEVACVDWTAMNDDFLIRAAPDVVVAADIVYDRALFPGLVRTLETLGALR